MKHSTDDNIFQTNLLQALQKNKIIQGKLIESQHSYYIQLLKDMQIYNLQEKYNRELLYTWKKESYVRQLKKNLEEYERKRFGVRDAYYEYQLKNLGNIIAGQQSVVIPPSEEERRLNINAKYQKFLEKNPIQTSSSMRVVKSANILSEQTKNEKNEEEENTREFEQTWKHIHAQSALNSRRKKTNMFPTIKRSSTMNEIRRNNALTKSLTPPTVAVVSSLLVTTTPELINSTSDEKIQRSPVKSSSNHLGLPDGIEPLLITSETLEKHGRGDLVAMRSVRRPRKNQSDLNLQFETRKRIYQINKRALDYHPCQRKYFLKQNIQYEQTKKIDQENNLIDNNQKQSDKIVI